MTTPKNKGFRTRRRDSSREDVNREEELEKFFSEAEEPRVEELTIDQRVERRAQGRYFNATSYRTTEEQKELLKFAAAHRGKVSKHTWKISLCLRRNEILVRHLTNNASGQRNITLYNVMSLNRSVPTF